MDRHWLLTSTFYGNWLPGDPRGFVSRVTDDRPDDPATPVRHEHDRPGTPCDADVPGLRRSAAALMKGEPVRLSREQVDVLLEQFRETAAYRGWTLLAAAITPNHVHLVVGCPSDPDPPRLLQAFKSYASRALTARFGRPAAGTWWTAGGSARKLPDEAAVQGAVRYVAEQHAPLVVWIVGERGT